MAQASRFSAPHFHDDTAARAYLEALRWPEGPICPHCGAINHAYAIRPAGTYRCAEKECRGNFTVTINSPMERSHIALHKWVLAFHLMCSSKKGVSAHQLHRTLGITYRSAWFMAHRIRECMRAGGLSPPMGSGGTAVEADESFIGRIKGEKVRQGGHHKNAFLSLVDRETKQVRSFHIDQANAENVAPIINTNLSEEAHLMTDQGKWYRTVGKTLARHETVDHSSEEYVRYVSDPETGESYAIHTNTLEGYFSLFKRGMKGIYQHCSEKHLHRYLAEFDFRYSNRIKLGIDDVERADIALKGIVGKRLTYRMTSV